MEKSQEKQVFQTKSISEVPFKSELFSKDCSFELLHTVARKSYYDFIRDCQKPELLFEVIMLKRDQPHFPDIVKINKINRKAQVLAFFVKIIAGKKNANALKCAIYRNYLPKKQYAHVQ